MGHGNAVHKHSGGVGSNAHELALAGRLAARDERIATEARRLRRLADGPRWAEIREAQERAGRHGLDAGAMLTLAAAAEIYTPEWRTLCR